MTRSFDLSSWLVGCAIASYKDKFEMPDRLPNRHAKKAVLYTNLEFPGTSGWKTQMCCQLGPPRALIVIPDPVGSRRELANLSNRWHVYYSEQLLAGKRQ